MRFAGASVLRVNFPILKDSPERARTRTTPFVSSREVVEVEKSCFALSVKRALADTDFMMLSPRATRSECIQCQRCLVKRDRTVG